MSAPQPLLERYRSFVARDGETFPITLGEGGTPLIHARRLGDEIGVANLYLKFEGTNPTGSFKD
ncbi:MAG: pyridoxal-phosphate dependent enzyme, partial [Chloroflexota bacterium]|nr:pyridoxal-phosphate dependent enzyme [Chloroflexota bacterium]